MLRGGGGKCSITTLALHIRTSYDMYIMHTYIKQTMTVLGLAALVAVAVVSVLFPANSFAAGNNGCETDTAIIKCDNVNVDEEGVENSGLWSILLTVVNILTAGVGVLALAGIVYGAVLYTSAGGNTEQVKKAYGIFTNVVIGVLAFAGMFALLNFIVPGGVFN